MLQEAYVVNVWPDFDCFGGSVADRHAGILTNSQTDKWTVKLWKATTLQLLILFVYDDAAGNVWP